MTREEWEDLIFTSDYLAGVQIQKCLEDNEVEEAKMGLQMLLESQKMWEQSELQWKLRDLMFHVLIGILVPQKRTAKWSIELDNMRTDIENHRHKNPVMDDNYVKTIWNTAFEVAKENAQLWVSQSREIPELSWGEVFEKEYSYRRKTKKI